MGDKYIIEKHEKDSIWRMYADAYGDVTVEGVTLTPYTEPDMEKVGEEAYQQGYEQGYKDGYNEPGKGKIQVGDEVTLKCGVRPAIYMQGTKGSDEIYLLFNDGSCGLHSKSEIERKTGRHFPEIVSVLEKMRGEKDG